MVNKNAQDWLNEKYPENGVCQRDSDSENKNKARKDIIKLDIRKEKVGSRFNSKILFGSLKLERFINLRVLICSGHELAELDLRECSNLEELYCQNNQLYNLDITGCSNLKKLNCVSNNLKKVDVSKCSELTEKEITSDLDYKDGELAKNIAETFKAEENDIRNILIVGITGNGKSALANVLTNTNEFVEKSLGVSVTNRYQRSDIFEWEKDGKKVKYRVIDNIGFNDTNKLTIADILKEIGKGIYSAENRINQILFVISGKFNDDQIKAFNLFKDFIAETGITKFNTIVRTNFSNFKDPKRREEDRDSLLAENEEIREIIGSCNDIIYVDNPPIPEKKEGIDEEEYEDERKVSERKRRESREVVLTHLVEKCSEIYKLKKWKNISSQIDKWVGIMEEKRRKIDRASGSERIKLQSELETAERKFAEQIDVAFGIKIGLNPELNAQIEMKNVNCCSIS